MLLKIFVDMEVILKMGRECIRNCASSKSCLTLEVQDAVIVPSMGIQHRMVAAYSNRCPIYSGLLLVFTGTEGASVAGGQCQRHH